MNSTGALLLWRRTHIMRKHLLSIEISIRILLFTGLLCSTNAYISIHLKDYLCADKFLIKLQKPFRGDPAFTLSDGHDSAAIITQRWNVTPFGIYDANSHIKYDCHFRVQTTDEVPHGIYTIITHLKFRHAKENGTCLDYIEFSGGNKSPSKRYCHDIPKNGVEMRLFEDRQREVNVHIHIDKRHMILEPLELRMIMTAHFECKFGGFQCNENVSDSCISPHLVRDNVTNCIYSCRDEISCFSNGNAPVTKVNATNIAITAVMSLIFTMFAVSFCVWICWKYWACITIRRYENDASAIAAAQRNRHSDVPTIELPNAPSYDDAAITSDIHHEQQQNLQMPKDLPPSYESLFPDR